MAQNRRHNEIYEKLNEVLSIVPSLFNNDIQIVYLFGSEYFMDPDSNKAKLEQLKEIMVTCGKEQLLTTDFKQMVLDGSYTCFSLTTDSNEDPCLLGFCDVEYFKTKDFQVNLKGFLKEKDTKICLKQAGIRISSSGFKVANEFKKIPSEIKPNQIGVQVESQPNGLPNETYHRQGRQHQICSTKTITNKRNELGIKREDSTTKQTCESVKLCPGDQVDRACNENTMEDFSETTMEKKKTTMEKKKTTMEKKKTTMEKKKTTTDRTRNKNSKPKIEENKKHEKQFLKANKEKANREEKFSKQSETYSEWRLNEIKPDVFEAALRDAEIHWNTLTYSYVYPINRRNFIGIPIYKEGMLHRLEQTNKRKGL